MPRTGSLSVLEFVRDLNFEVKRVYYVYDAYVGTIRGRHAHKKLQQLLICVKGVIKIDVDNGEKSASTILDNASVGLWVAPKLWHTMEWLESGSVLLVMASLPYDESDYIRDYTKFLEWIKNNGSNPI